MVALLLVRFCARAYVEEEERGGERNEWWASREASNRESIEKGKKT
jgi:hypothetical protein